MSWIFLGDNLPMSWVNSLGDRIGMKNPRPLSGNNKGGQEDVA